MLNKTAQIDVYNGTNLVNATRIITYLQLKKFFTNQGYKPARAERIIQIMLAKGLAHQIPNTEYIVSNPMISYAEFTPKLDKAIWLYIDSIGEEIENDIFNFYCKFPAILYLSHKNSMLDETTVFYIKEGEEGVMSRIIDTNYGCYTKFDAIIVVDKVEQIEKIKLADAINVKYFAVIDTNGSVNYYEVNYDKK